MRIKDEVLSNGSFVIKDGTNTRFCDDTWIGDIARDKHVTVSKVLSSRPLNISFRRSLVDNNLSHWLHLVAQVSNVVLVDDKHYFKWRLTKSGFSLFVHCIYMT
jgi:hypothetical protein